MYATPIGPDLMSIEISIRRTAAGRVECAQVCVLRQTAARGTFTPAIGDMVGLRQARRSAAATAARHGISVVEEHTWQPS